jgi:hypothetical protein
MAATLEDGLSPLGLDVVGNYFTPIDQEADFQNLEQEAKPEASHVELKELLLGLKYVFLNGDQNSLVIISDKLSNDETQKLVTALKKYRLVIGYSLADLEGISSSFCTHRIPMEQDHKHVWEHQHKLNNVMREVVKKVVLKLLKAGVIYPISNSEWVSPVQVVSKKSGMTIVKNEKNELITQMTVTSWCMCIDYKKLNKAIRKDHFPLPFIDKMLERLANHFFFCYLDGYSGYHEIPIHSED